MSNYRQLIEQLDSFIRKYYANQLLRGGLIFLSCLLAYVLLITVGEYYFYFRAWLKITILVVLAVAGLFALVFWICMPFLKMQRLGKIISRERAAQIIGVHFPQVSDKLLNILQLHDASASDPKSSELIYAAIEQKAQSIAVIPLLKAVDLGKNKRYLRFLLPPAVILLFIIIAAPNMFKEASSRLLQPEKNFTPPAPFQFIVENKNLRTPRYEPFTLQIATTGKQLPQQVFVIVNDEKIEMQPFGKNKFSYTFQHVSNDLDFSLNAAGYSSKKYRLSVIRKPRIEELQVKIEYPAYTGQASETISGLSDLSLPQGTILKWEIKAKHTDEILLRMGDSGTAHTLQHSNPKNEISSFNAQYRFMQDTAYAFIISNKQMPHADSFRYQVQITPDLAPQVTLEELKDSISGQQVVLSGNASDDYGISRLYFHYTILNEQHQTLSQKDIPLKTAPGNISPYQFYFDFGTLQVLPGQQVNYYIEAWDNDAVNGSKSARSAVMTYKLFDGKSVDSAINESSEQIAKGLNSSSARSKHMENDMKDLKSELLQSESMSWEQQEKMKSLINQQMQLKDQVEAVRQQFKAQQQQTDLKEYSEPIKEKEEAIEEQLDNLANKELEEQLKKLQEMMQQLNKENAFQQLQQMEQQNKLFNMDMERIQELMKQLEMQMKLEDLANKLEQLDKDQGQLQKSTDQQERSGQELSKSQKDLKQQLDQLLSKDMKELDQLNKEQSDNNQKDLSDIKDAGKEASKDMQESSDQLQQQQNSKSSQSQQNARQNMQQMMAQMRQMASGMDMQQLDIDIKATRQLLTNLIRFSFRQEDLMNKVKKTSPASSVYIENSQEQKQLSANARMIRDSLFALSKRIYQLSATINKETVDLSTAIDQSINALEARNIPQAVTRQQYAMTSANNLALLLNETLANLMQMQAQAMMSGSGSNAQGQPKPGQGKPSSAGQMMKDIITGQQQMGKGLEKMGAQPGGQQGQGQSGNGMGEGEGSEGNAEQIARLAQQQASLRRQIQQLNSLLNSKGMGGNARLMKEIQENMDRVETDLVNKRGATQLLERQKEIMSRLLQAEKAIREQEEDDKRSANAGKDEPRPLPPQLRDYLKSRQALLDLYKTSPPTLKPYYKKMAEEYLNRIKQP